MTDTVWSKMDDFQLEYFAHTDTILSNEAKKELERRKMLQDDIQQIYGNEKTLLDFGTVLRMLKQVPSRKFAREGWNGKGIYISLQVPDEHSKMTLPYIYIVTKTLITDNEYAPKGLCPWLASQTDMLAEDWKQVFYD